MANKTTSKTVKDSFVLENIFGIGGHHKTTISDGRNKVEGLGQVCGKIPEGGE